MGVVLVAALVFVVTHLGELENFLQLARNASPAWLLVGLMLQAGTYVCAAGVWQLALRQAGQRLSLWSLVPLGIAKLFSDQALPTGGASGAGLVVSALSRRGVPPERSVRVLLQGMLGYYLAYVGLALASLVLLWVQHMVTHWVVVSVTAFFVVMVALPVLVLGLSRVGRRALPAWSRRWPWLQGLADGLRGLRAGVPRGPGLTVGIAALHVSVFLLDALTLWAMLAAIGVEASFLAVVPSFVIASIVATISPIPLGLGVFEAGCVAMLTAFGIGAEAALTGTLLLRGLTVWLPMVPGLWLARRAMR